MRWKAEDVNFFEKIFFMRRSHFQPHLLRFSCRIEEGCKPKNEQFLVEKRAKK